MAERGRPLTRISGDIEHNIGAISQCRRCLRLLHQCECLIEADIERLQGQNRRLSGQTEAA